MTLALRHLSPLHPCQVSVHVWEGCQKRNAEASVGTYVRVFVYRGWYGMGQSSARKRTQRVHSHSACAAVYYNVLQCVAVCCSV